MKRCQSSVKEFVGDAVLLGAFAVTKNCMERLERKMNEESKDEEAIQRKLTMMSVVYHALGIFYNE